MSEAEKENNKPEKSAKKPGKAAGKPEKANVGGGTPKPSKKAKKEEKSGGTKVSVGEAAREAGYVPRFKKRYDEVIRPALIKEFGYKNGMQVPRLNKIVLNIGAGEGAQDAKKIQSAQNDLTAIAGQKAVVTRAKKSISTFKITAGKPVGVKVTLRRERMYEFLDRLITTAMPRIRDFRGLSGKSFDGRGNYALGLKEHIVFLEIDYDKTENVWGMDIIINTTAKTDKEAKALLKGFQFPFVN